MPAALLVTQRNVPIRLIWMMRSKLSSGYSLISRVAADPGAVDQDTLLADRGARLGERGVDLRRRGHVDLAEHAADFRGQRLAKITVEIEERDLDAMRRQHPRGGRAKPRRTAGHDGRNRRIQLHSSASSAGFLVSAFADDLRSLVDRTAATTKEEPMPFSPGSGETGTGAANLDETGRIGAPAPARDGSAGDGEGHGAIELGGA
jgi:hypothetical protein